MKLKKRKSPAPDHGHLCFGFPVDYTPWLEEPFVSLVRRVTGVSACDPIRLWMLAEVVHLVGRRMGRPIVMVEVGVWKGGSARVLLEQAPPTSEIHLFDTFTGTPSEYLDNGFPEGKFSDTSVDEVHAFLDGAPGWATSYPGVFPQTAGLLAPSLPFDFIHADANLYASTKAVIEVLLPRLNAGGAVVFDDYGQTACSGVRRAVDEMLPGQVLYLPTGQALYLKEA